MCLVSCPPLPTLAHPLRTRLPFQCSFCPKIGRTFLTLNLHACRQPIWAQVRQVKPTKCNTNNYGVSLTTTKHAEIIHQSTPQIRITSQYLPIAQMTITSVRNKFARPTSPGANRATTSQRVPRLWCPCSASQATSNQISNCWYFAKFLDHRVPGVSWATTSTLMSPAGPNQGSGGRFA